ncbi:MAG: porin [Hyphomicrobiales bacterium]|nr:porin [Hyphomicrobiales bacterium]
MKLARGPLIGFATALAVVAGAEAADLPSPRGAPAADYAKVCENGGVAGFIIPGSNACLAINGYVSAGIAMGGGGLGAAWSRAGDIDFYTRGQFDFDALANTAEGPLLAHVALRADAWDRSVDWVSQQPALREAYVQWAGFTVGKHSSFFWPAP